MAKCGNCGKRLGCSCKARKALDGRSCCVSCVTGYNNKIKHAKKQQNNNKTSDTDPIVLNATATQWIDPNKDS
jgi:hypothetical protein